MGTAARLDPVKDLGSLLAAAASLRARGTRVTTVVVGDGGERAALEEAARSARL